MKHKPKVGSKMDSWVSHEPDKKSTVLKVEPYRGAYPQWFKWVVTLTAPNTMNRQIQMAV